MDVNVLLIEDNQGDARLFQEMINEINLELNRHIEFFHKKDLEKDLKRFIKEKEISIVFLDLGLTQTKGEETLGSFKKLNKNIPVVAYTGTNDIFLGAKLLQLGADDYICKIDATPSVIIKTIWLNIQRRELKKTLKEKERLLIVQSRNAAMGEMIGMIAHQWKQPLSVLAMIANNMKADYMLGDVRTEEFESYADEISQQVEHLSKTIDDFRDFFKPNNNRENISLVKVVKDALSLIDKSLINNGIEIITDFEDIGDVNIFPNELIHVLINIIKNAKEVLMERAVADKKIFLRIYKNKFIYIEVEDTAGGVPSEIIDKIFEPYFSTKEKMNGTGLGLYMSKMIIEEHFKGAIRVKNTENGADFIIKIPFK